MQKISKNIEIHKITSCNFYIGKSFFYFQLVLAGEIVIWEIVVGEIVVGKIVGEINGDIVVWEIAVGVIDVWKNVGEIVTMEVDRQQIN